MNVVDEVCRKYDRNIMDEEPINYNRKAKDDDPEKQRDERLEQFGMIGLCEKADRRRP